MEKRGVGLLLKVGLNLLSKIQCIFFYTALVFICVLSNEVYADSLNDKLVSVEPYPVGNLEVLKDDISSSSFRLKIQNLNLASENGNRNRTQTWLIAGVRGKLPVVSVEAAEYLQLKDDKVTSRTKFAPDNVRQNLARIAEVGQFRQWWVYALTITSASPGSGANYWLLDTADIRIDLNTPDNIPAMDSSRYTSFGEPELLKSVLLNPDISPSYYVYDYSDPVASWEEWNVKAHASAKSGDLFTFSVFKNGVYRITKSELETSKGKPIASDPTQWKIFSNGSEVPTATGGSDSVILPIFNIGRDGFFEHVYWIDTASATDGEKSVQIPIQKSASSDSLVTSISLKQKFREFVDYSPRFRHSDQLDRWFWKEMKANNPERFQINLPEKFDPTVVSNVKITFQYGFVNFPSVVPTLKAFVNGVESGETTLTIQQGTVDLFTRANLWKPNETTLTLILNYPENTEVQRPVSLQSIEVQWKQEKLILSETPQFLQANDLGSTEASRFHIAASQVNAFPRLLGIRSGSATEIIGDKQGFSTDDGYDQFIAFSNSNALKVGKLTHITDLPNLKQLVSGKSIVIAPASFEKEALELAAFQKARGIDSIELSTKDCYNLFNFGNPGSLGIRNGLRYLFYKANGPAPEYVTLVGEASDFHGDPSVAPEDVQLDLLPSSSDASPESPQGDQLYAAAIGSDLICDFIVGRIPASKPEQVTDYLVKVRSYLDQPSTSTRSAALFAMDDNDEFPEVVQRITESSESPGLTFKQFRQWDYPYVPNMRVPGKKRSWEATADLIKDFNEGISILNFFGHGGPNLWSHERLLHLSDLPLLHNLPLLPFISCASCDSAWISYPVPPVKASMGELLVLKKDGGGIGLFGPVAGASPYEHLLLIQNLMNGIGRVQLRNMGDLVLYAKNQYYAESRSSSIPDQYLLLGDPTVELQIPRLSTGLQANSSVLEPGKAYDVTLKNQPDFDDGAIQLFRSFGEDQPPISIPVKSGAKQATIRIPEDFQSGIAYLQFTTTGSKEQYGLALRVNPKSGVKEVTQPVQVYGGSYELKHLESNAPIAGTMGNTTHRFQIRTLDETTSSVQIKAFVNNQPYAEVPRIEIATPGEFTDFEMNSSVPIEGTSASMTLEITSLNSKNSVQVSSATVYLPDSPKPNLEIVPGSVKVSDGPYISNHTVFISATIRNTGEVPLRNLTYSVTRGDPTTGTELTTINDGTNQRILFLPPNTMKEISFRLELTSKGDYSDLYIVANKARTNREANYEDNFASVPPFKVDGEGNYRIESLTVTPSLAIAGTTVTMQLVAQYENPANNHPVALETGWIRDSDRKTSSTTEHVSFEDGYVTVTRELIANESMLSAFAKINSDLDVEENNPGDNQLQINSLTAVPLNFISGKSADLSATVDQGNTYNVSQILPGELRLADKVTSTYNYLLVGPEHVKDGKITHADVETDGLWRVTPWSMKASSKESLGSIDLSFPISDLSHDVPGALVGMALSEVSSPQSVQFRKTSNEQWTTLTCVKYGTQPFVYDFGEHNTVGSKLEFQLMPTATDFDFSYFLFKPKAMEWLSTAYSCPPEYQGRPMEFSMDVTDRDAAETIYLDCRTGRLLPDGNVEWSELISTKDNQQLKFTSDQFLQFRVLVVPKGDAKPILKDFKLKVL